MVTRGVCEDSAECSRLLHGQRIANSTPGHSLTESSFHLQIFPDLGHLGFLGFLLDSGRFSSLVWTGHLELPSLDGVAKISLTSVAMQRSRVCAAFFLTDLRVAAAPKGSSEDTVPLRWMHFWKRAGYRWRKKQPRTCRQLPAV